LSDQEAEEKLTRHATSRVFTPVKPTSVVRFDTNYVECNDPIEDRHAEDFVDRNKLYTNGVGGVNDPVNKDGSAAGIKLFSILDGHSGWQCSQLLSNTLHPMILLSLRSLYAGNYPPTDFDSPTSSTDFLRLYVFSLVPKMKRKIVDTFPFLASPAEVSPQTISNSIISAFLALDQQIVTSPLRLIPHVPGKPGQPNVRPIVAPMIGPAVSGACAINLLVDEEREEIYISNTGDCRAVAGYWVPGENGQPGGWRCEVLSEDMMGDNPNEVKRSVVELIYLESTATDRFSPGYRENIPVRIPFGVEEFWAACNPHVHLVSYDSIVQPERLLELLTIGDAPLYKWSSEDYAR
jgi:pyruvate dehydrogenase phosphatase